jgi:hypothetical protein
MLFRSTALDISHDTHAENPRFDLFKAKGMIRLKDSLLHRSNLKRWRA